jgi:hypothetical protein
MVARFSAAHKREKRSVHMSTTAPKSLFVNDGPDPAGEACISCGSNDGQVCVFNRPGASAFPLHEACAPAWLEEYEKYDRAFMAWCQRTDAASYRDRPQRPDWLEKRYQERQQFIAAQQSFKRDERSTEPEPPECMRAQQIRRDAQAAKRAPAQPSAKILSFSPQRQPEDTRERAAIATIKAQMGVDAASARLIYQYRTYGSLARITSEQFAYVEALEEQWAKIKAARALGIPLTGDPNAKSAPTYKLKPEPRQFTLTPFEQIRINPTPAFVVKGIIPRQGLVTTWGAPKCGKSFLIFDLAMRVALGWEYRGCKVQQGAVVYCAAEGGIGFANRVEAWRQRYLAEGSTDPIPFYLLAIPLDLIAEHAALIAAIEEQANGAPTLVVLDTLNRTLVGSENKPEDMARYIRAADAIRMAFGCAVIIIHHCGVNESRPRGHTSLTGADDAQIAVTRDSNGLIRVKVEHIKDGVAAPPFGCRLENVELGTDQDGNEISSCVIVAAELVTADAKARGGKITANQQRFLDILADAIVDAPPQYKTTINIPGDAVAISREWLKMCCIAKGWLDDTEPTDQKRLKVNNMINLLAGKRLIGATKLFVWDAR